MPLITLGMLLLVAWGALRLASPEPDRPRVDAGKQVNVIQPTHIDVDAETGLMTVTGVDSKGRVRTVRMLPQDLTEDGEVPEEYQIETPQSGPITIEPEEKK